MSPSVRREIRLTTGYFDCTKRINRLKRFQNLLRHRERWAHQIHFAPPLARLIPELSKAPSNDERSGLFPNLTLEQINATREPGLIDREINRLTPMVHAYLHAVNISTRFSFVSRQREFDEEHARLVNRDTERNIDLVLDYFLLPRVQGSAQNFETLLGIVEQGVGIYAARQHVAKLELFNPLIWIATVLRAPLYVLERAGFDESPSAVQSTVFHAYAWLVRLIVVVILIFAATKLGISIPWRQLWVLIT